MHLLRQRFSQAITILVRSHLDYADIFYAQMYPQKKLGS